MTPTWKIVVKNQITDKIKLKQDIQTIKEIRKVYYDLLANSVPAEEIIKEITI